MLGIIPSRYASTRLPGKPLVYIKGKTMIQRVYENAMAASSLNDVIVATDDERISNHVKEFGGKVVMTSPAHKSGTDRCCEALKKEGKEYEYVINIQGDEPFINPEQINLLAKCLKRKNTVIATLVKKISNLDELIDINTPKVIVNECNEAMYFSRTPIPFLRNMPLEKWLKEHTYYKHIGIYGYKTEVLFKITKLSESLLEKAESLEQLRWMEAGYKIHTAVTEQESISIDTLEDLKKVSSRVSTEKKLNKGGA